MWAFTKVTFTRSLCVAVTFLFLFFCRVSYSNWWTKSKVYRRQRYLVETGGCRMPELDPFHQSIRPFYEKRSPYSCEKGPSPIKVTKNVLTLNDLVVRQFYNSSVPRCFYRWIRRPSDPNIDYPDDTVNMSRKWLRLKFDEPIHEDAVQVWCIFPSKQVFQDYVPLVYLKPEIEERCSTQQRAVKNPRVRLNVLFVGVDSISKLNFQRHFLKTRKLLGDLKFVELSGYNKVADNTFPNLYALLVGKPAVHLPKRTGQFYDDTELIWKRYSRLGYRTMLAEDLPAFSIFNYLRNGFVNQPTDFYLRPYALAAERSRWRIKSRRYCFGHKMETEAYYDYTLNLLDTLNTRPFFAFVFMARLTHDYLNNAGYADVPSFNLLNSLSRRGSLNNTLVFFFSDHGIRFGPIRDTYFGKFEENWPFMFLSVPDWFLRDHPSFGKNLRVNERRLTTPYDIHETLAHHVDLLSGTFRNHSESRLGTSLFAEIDETRTCEQAGIAKHWCTCQMLGSVPVNDILVVEASIELLKILNYWADENDRCQKLYLQDILEARMVDVSSVPEILVKVVVYPSGGVIESTLSRVNGKWNVLGGISRINRYGNEGKCTDDLELIKFCYCSKR